MPEFTSYAPGVPSWVDLSWSDLAGAHRFYQGLFGWEVLELGPDAGGYAMFAKDGKLVAGVGPKMGGDQQPSAWQTYVNVADSEETARRIAGAGGRVVAGPMQVLESGKLTAFHAPDGSFCATWEPGNHTGAQLANEPGAFCWNELQTSDTAAAQAFYTSVFGWSTATEDMGGTPYTLFQVNDAPIGGMTGTTEPGAPSHWLVYFAVTSCDDAVRRATGLGASVVAAAIDSPVGRFAVLSDPEGAPFALIEMPPGS